MNDDTLLARWLAGELADNELKELKNSPRYATLLKIKENFKNIESPNFTGEEMLEEILQQKKTAPKMMPLYRRYWMQAAAMIIILLGLGYFYTLPEKLSAGYGETYAFVLPDASEVILNAGSTASYREWNWNSNREINLDGEAYFKVAKGKTFTVKTQQGEVTVLGTQFNVKNRGERFEVVCYQGRVSVVHHGFEIILAPGQSVSYDEGSKNTVVQTSVKEPEWTQNMIAFSDENLTGIIEELERVYNINIETEYKTDQLFKGTLPAKDLSAALSIISLSYHLEITRKADTVILIPLHAKP